jgi:hypothetical protein
MQATKVTCAALLLAGCSDGLFGKDSQTMENPYSGARLTVSVTDDNDVVGFHFEVERVACTAGEDFERFFYEENVALDDTVFPGRIEFLEAAPFGADSAHLGADFFIALDPGCYVVTAVPASELSEEDWTPSVDCSTAVSDPLEVIGGYTTETVLISQCAGDLVGALDTIVLLNTPPVVVPSIENKFNNQCEPVQVCATGWDPDDDPIEFDFVNLSSHEFFAIEIGEMTLVDYESGARVWEQCATIVTEEIADYTLEIRAYDLAYDEHGAEVRIEDLIAEASHGWIQIPIHTGWTMSESCVLEDGSIDYDVPGDMDDDGDYDEDDCEVETPDDGMCEIISDEAFFCSGLYDVDADLVALICDGTALREDVLYPECDLD